uniref:Reverse transcriptase domain-containing protein n=1 Tax=Pygocentrus nattereri TaxID=42514 RepID=A0AAR2M1F7_PYGNA
MSLFWIFPTALKTTAVTPILKKPELNPTSLSNYRPISHLPFLAKVMERLVASQLQILLSDNALCEPFQSCFCTHHSTETALLRVVNDLLCSANSGSLSIVLLYDLSAAFNTVNHDVLISCLFSTGITDSVIVLILSYPICSYLTDRHQFITLSTQVLHLSCYMWCPSGLSSWTPAFLNLHLTPRQDHS